MELRDVLQQSPTLFPLNWDSDGQAVRLGRLSEQDYARASFLDSRLVESGLKTALVPWAEFERAAVGLTADCDFIFHVSHAGSTLVSRLLELSPHCFCLREPEMLRWFATGAHRERLPIVLATLSRVFRPPQRAVIKVTSWGNAISSRLMDEVPSARAILMFVPLASFLPAVLDGSLHDASVQQPLRRQRFQQIFPSWDLPANLASGEEVALLWLVEMLTLWQLHQQYQERTLWLNFERLLVEREAAWNDIFRTLKCTGDVGPVLSSELWQRYSKRPDVQYDANFRAELIRQGTEKHATEVRRGLAWIENMASHLPLEVADLAVA